MNKIAMLERMHNPGLNGRGGYRLLDPRQKYNLAFCTEEEIAIAEHFREFVDSELMPHRHDIEGGWHRDPKLAKATIHRLYAKLHDFGVTKAILPAKHGGPGLSPVVRQMINEELSRADIGLATKVGKLHWAISVMVAAGRDDLLEEFAPRITGPDAWTACFAITEPAGGANVEDPALAYKTMNTIAREDGDDYVLNGHKLWPGPAGPAENFQSEHLKGHLGYWVCAITRAGGGEDNVGIFYVPSDAEGLEFSQPYEKMGFCYSEANTDIWFKDVRIPKRYRIDTETGQGSKLIKGYVIGLGRLAGAARLTGLSEAVLETCMDWTQNRIIAGKPMRERSLFAATLAEMWRSIEMSRQYYLSVTAQVTQPEIYGMPWEAQMKAKFSAARSFAGDTAMMVTNRAMQLMGSAGYAYESHIEKYMRDYKIVQMWLGGAERDRMDMAQGLFGPFNWAGDA
ncbi:acyl-CoA dehydrogenase family protein [Microbaculum marinisediminis]|uniref:Medium-chain specific acyl-CoA dehydrogenase, mitochondrial n=1 Tax=Microbaculum marinisediminis TaxID=2931392 RepID=A0AAW5QY32_9HYPH|nr:acyl-CoA dehydrogenase family protein [Microbaculum sp. A6E488]MCT8971804.1 acyl-CoA/acyl-ACP dehydrogenase [Microbaculum sp. A6E488]